MSNLLFDTFFTPHKDNTSVFFHLEDGKTQTYAEFLCQVEHFSYMLVKFGLQAGDRLAVICDKSPEMIALYGAAIQRGIVFLPLNPAYTVAEIEYFVKDSGAKLLITDPTYATKLCPLALRYNIGIETLGTDKQGSIFQNTPSKKIAQNTFENQQTVERCPHDIAAILYTSGTTGQPKGAIISHQNLVSNAKQLVKSWHFTAHDRLIHALPIFHTHGLFVAINVAMLAGATIDFLLKFSPKCVLKRLSKATAMMGVPTFYTRLLNEKILSPQICSNMRLFISGSAPLLEQTHRLFAQKTGHVILERYGMTETNMITTNPYHGARKAGTVGKPLNNVELRLRSKESDQILTQAEIKKGAHGIIEVRGDNVFQGYWGMPEKTTEAIHDDGFFITGDIGCLDADGYLKIAGRDKDVIISGGYNIYPSEIEQIFNRMDGVEESAIIGVPHPDLGEVAVCVIRMTSPPSFDEKDALANALLISATAKLARYKHPRRIIFKNSLPRNIMGKVQKNILRAHYEKLFLKTTH